MRPSYVTCQRIYGAGVEREGKGKEKKCEEGAHRIARRL